MIAFLQRFGFWVLERAEEKSTWAGIALMGACAGRDIPQSVMELLQFWGPMLATGLVVASTNEKGKA